MIGFSFRQLEYFVAVAEHGSISAAARARHVSQPSVSVAIAQLEEALNERLFRRQVSRGLELTSAGTRLLAQARDIIGMAIPRAARFAATCRSSAFKTWAPITRRGCYRVFASSIPMSR
ncbi:HTH-type transcriptional regulator TdfR [compost metagenome]